jgi:hypothetical protein
MVTLSKHACILPRRLFDPGQDHRHGIFHAAVLAVGRGAVART